MTQAAIARKRFMQARLGGEQEAKQALNRLAKNLTAVRESRGISKIQLAQDVGVAFQTIWNIERALNWPGMPLYRKICKALDQPNPPLL